MEMQMNDRSLLGGDEMMVVVETGTGSHVISMESGTEGDSSHWRDTNRLAEESVGCFDASRLETRKAGSVRRTEREAEENSSSDGRVLAGLQTVQLVPLYPAT